RARVSLPQAFYSPLPYRATAPDNPAPPSRSRKGLMDQGGHEHGLPPASSAGYPDALSFLLAGRRAVVVRLLLEVPGIRLAVDLAADRAGELLLLAEFFVLADEARAHPLGIALQGNRLQLDLERGVLDAQEQLVRLDRRGRLGVALEQVDG